ncbi:NAD(P)-dependent oxidoreductase [Robertmurraya yapensis]|uniref:NAD(P)-dependent oxidoreductase n=2 Tax=Bacillaceae TaxID=186817 RepID=A0A431W3D5_9BACI|nr:DUF1932 domain-containing protein [Bacillus yapensis]RTR29950.1 NAD(P)-dependent oxidoreductase [Bacillus yapensis]TKS95031.1 NAD(P)-dependent oxidoreductase [Bacillus yapensis]
MKSEIRLGFIGFGEVAQSISAGLMEVGFGDLFAYHYRGLHVSTKLQEQAKELGVRLVGTQNELTKECNIIFNVTRTSVARDTAFGIMPFLTKEHLYVDLNSTSPLVKREIAEVFDKQGLVFIDGVLMAPLPLTKHRVPIIASGAGADRLAEILKPLEMNIEVIEGSPGTASSIKMIRSMFMKGLATLLIETFVAAKQSGDGYEKIMGSIRQTMDTTPFDTLMERFLTGTAKHSGRRIGEMESALSYVSESGMVPVMTKATNDLLQMISTAKDAQDSFLLPSNQDELYSFYKNVFTEEENR